MSSVCYLRYPAELWYDMAKSMNKVIAFCGTTKTSSMELAPGADTIFKHLLGGMCVTERALALVCV